MAERLSFEVVLKWIHTNDKWTEKLRGNQKVKITGLIACEI